MKISQKIALLASVTIVVTFTAYSWLQYQTVKNTLLEKTQQTTQEAATVLGYQITNWLNAKLGLIDLMAQTIDQDFNADTIQRTFDLPMLKKEFILIFGGLETDGKRITNDVSWNPPNWDARKRPWYPYAKNNKQAVLTDPYPDAATKEILISAVANFSKNGQFMGAFGGDLSLKTVSDALNKLNFHNTGYAFLVDAKGSIISHPNADLNSKSYSTLFDGQSPTMSTDLHEASVNGDQVLTAFYKLENLYGSNWLVGVVLNKQQVMAEANKLGITAVIATLISALICSAALYITLTKQLAPLQNLRKSLQEINSGEGDLTRRLPVGRLDEFGQVSTDFNRFVEYLQGLIVQIKQITSEVRDNSALISDSASGASGHLTAQLYELDQLATAMNEMSATAQEVAQNAQHAADAVNQADAAAAAGADVVAHTSSAIESLSNDMEGVVKTINDLASYSNNIESILTVITGIAEQTNLLALNAAIEAARAGETGRGFAVVADEVRALASRTQQSTEEIKNMIQQLQSGVRTAESTILKSRDRAKQTQLEASKANEVLTSIRTSISDISQMTIQIATAAEQQSATAEEINRNASNIRDLGQSVADGAKDQEQSCKTMAGLAYQQDDLLGKFKV
ncbi:methyl-accepting chemotaxis sensory transducer with Cache sensor [Oceanospirillum multiglobuliferum]|uniref:Chemotaxis protein n=1 Tax=Oceanospirillum multiglobuliferum TaxID=64969 RepID=A0A1T4PCJ5_9GAMM|nr:methyl-accepting chemotaxis protein [Oceanospirillum multiglobuliferum]OPX55609.1 chemotaxis protein [Oceanospirillum multiglobuliferum]SJZ89057.1 methyl-accepting chemotaxis sensory transducer with Cache sensor [Oceanospirillum multiglobuliferum]